MKIKLDENLGGPCVQVFIQAGYDCSTVSLQGLSGSTDSTVIEHCRTEGRAIVTLDRDFANPLLFKPSEYHGIAVLRPRSPLSPQELRLLCLTLCGGLSRDEIDGRLWIVELGRIRIYQEQSD